MNNYFQEWSTLREPTFRPEYLMSTPKTHWESQPLPLNQGSVHCFSNTEPSIPLMLGFSLVSFLYQKAINLEIIEYALQCRKISSYFSKPSLRTCLVLTKDQETNSQVSIWWQTMFKICLSSFLCPPPSIPPSFWLNKFFQLIDPRWAPIPHSKGIINCSRPAVTETRKLLWLREVLCGGGPGEPQGNR